MTVWSLERRKVRSLASLSGVGGEHQPVDEFAPPRGKLDGEESTSGATSRQSGDHRLARDLMGPRHE